MIHKKQTKYHITWQFTFLILCLYILFSGCQTKHKSTTNLVTGNAIEITTVNDINSALIERPSSDTKVKKYQEDFPCDINQKNRMRMGISGNGLLILLRARIMSRGYFENNEYLIDKSNWQYCFGQYQRKDRFISKPFQNSLMQNYDSSFAFNNRINNKLIKDMKPNIVLFFEAYGDRNLSGDLELLKIPREKDKYFYTKESIYVYVMFVDETIGRYRLYDGAISFYKSEDDIDKVFVSDSDFTEYHAKGETPYSPLQWE